MKILQISAPSGSNRPAPDRIDLSLARGLWEQGHDVELVGTGLADSTENKSGLKLTTFARSAPLFTARSAGLKRYVRDQIFEVFYHRGLGSRTLHYAHRAAVFHGIPFVISPRRLTETRRILNSTWSSSLAYRVIHPGAMRAANGWHVSSAKEADYIRGAGFSQPICITPAGFDIPSEQQLQIAQEFWKERLGPNENHQIALYHGPLHSRKRVVEMIDTWRPQSPPDWLLLIVGYDDEYTIEQIEKHILREGLQTRIRVIDGSYKPPPYAIANLYLSAESPDSNSTSTGEAMAAGIPVVTCNTNRWEAVNGKDAGWCVNYGAWGEAMQSALGESTALLSRRGRLAQDWIKAEFSWPQVADRLAGFFREIRESR